MASSPEPSTERLVADDLLLDKHVEPFEEAWQSGTPPRLDDFLPPADDRRHDVLVELIQIDLERRLRAGLPVKVEEYLERYPQLAADRQIALELVAAEYTWSHRAGKGVTIEHYVQRFPNLMPELAERLKGSAEEASRLSSQRWPVASKLLGRDSRDRKPPREPSENAQDPQTFPHIPSYEMYGLLGRGGMGIVYKAWHVPLKRMVALKMILAGSHAGEEERARFRLEAEAAARLQHPHIVQIYEVGFHEGHTYLALEFIDGGSLANRLKGQPQSPRHAAELIEVLAHAIDFAHHHGIVHRDLKPGNVLLQSHPSVARGERGDERRPQTTEYGLAKITDFGLAKDLDDDPLHTHTGAIMGTPSYMAPEQADGDSRYIGPETDVYALGAILHEMLTGRPPFQAETMLDTLQQVRTQEPVPPRRLQSKVPRDLETICLKCLEKNPAKRYHTAGGLADDLRRFLTGEPIQARATTSLERAIKWVRRRPAVAGLIAVSAVLVLGLLGLLAWQTVERATEEGRRRALHDQAQELIDAGGGALRRGDLAGARLHLSNAQLKIEDGKLDELAAVAGRLFEDLDSYDRFRTDRDTALYLATLSTGMDLAANLQATQAAARKALAGFGIDPESPRLPQLDGRNYADDQKQEIRAACYELLLILAGAMAQPLPNWSVDMRQENAQAALRILDGAAQLGLRTRAYHLRRARYLTQAGDVAGAKREELLASKVEPTTPDDFFLLGDDAYKRGQASEAITLFTQALARGFWARYMLGLSYLKAQKPDQARIYFTTCADERPDFIWVYLLRGLAHGQLQQFDAAERDFRKALELKPDDLASYALYVNRGVVRSQHDKPKQAAEDLLQAIRLNPTRYQAYVNLAQVYQRQGAYPEAFRQLERAIQLEPRLASLYRSRARLYLEQRTWKAARQDLMQAMSLEPQGSVAKGAAGALQRAEDQLALGRTFFHEADYSKALDAYEAALAVRADHSGAHLARAESALKLAETESNQRRKWFLEAKKSLDRYLARELPALQTAPANVSDKTPSDSSRASDEPRKRRIVAEACRARGQVRLELGEGAGAIDDFSQGLDIDPSVPLYLSRGWAYSSLGKDQAALADFSRAIQLEPNRGEAYAARGYLQVRAGQIAASVGDAEEAIRRSPNDSRTLQAAARVFATIGTQRQKRTANSANATYTTRALECLEKALACLPENDRPTFWKNSVAPDMMLAPLRSHRRFREWQARYTKP